MFPLGELVMDKKPDNVADELSGADQIFLHLQGAVLRRHDEG